MMDRELYDRILVAPDDDELRLIFADWCDSQNDPRGRFIRIQLALEHVGEYDPRRAELRREETRLLARYERLWSAPLHGLATGITFRRGLIDGVKMTARQFVHHADHVFAVAPVRHLDLLDAGSHASAVFASPLLSRLRELSLFAQHIGHDDLFELFVACPHLTSLRSLQLGRNNLPDRAVQSLCRSSFLPKLQELSLRENPCGDAGVLAIVEHASQLQRFDLTKTAISASGASTIARLAIDASLKSLNLSGNSAIGRLGHPTTALLGVSELNLSHCEFGLLELDRLLSDQPEAIRTLILHDNRLGNGGAHRIANSPSISNLRKLDLGRNEIGDDGAEALARSVHFRRMIDFNLAFNPLSPSGWACFLQPNSLPNCRRFGWSSTGMPDSLTASLVDKFR